MGMLIEGKWADADRIVVDGAYRRPESPIRADDTDAVAQSIVGTPQRFCLIVSLSCPWSHRAMLVRALKGLTVPFHYAFGERREGYGLNGGDTWQIPGTTRFAEHLHEVYCAHDPQFSGRVTVPVLWDSATQTIVSNESADILAVLDAMPAHRGQDFTLRPAALFDEISAANARVYDGLNNAVYQSGFAETQQGYDAAVTKVFDTLDALEQRLDGSRYYFGTVLTETDLRLFPTLVRFDAIYSILFKCSKRRLIDYPNLWAYARDLYGHRGVATTVDFERMRLASYLADTRDPKPIVAIAPEADWTEKHGREALGRLHLAGRDGEPFEVDPGTLQPTAGVA